MANNQQQQSKNTNQNDHLAADGTPDERYKENGGGEHGRQGDNFRNGEDNGGRSSGSTRNDENGGSINAKPIAGNLSNDQVESSGGNQDYETKKDGSPDLRFKDHMAERSNQ